MTCTGKMPRISRNVSVTPLIPCDVGRRSDVEQPSKASSSRSPEQVCAPESANVSVEAGLGSKLAENDRGNGNSFGSVSTSMWMVILGDGRGACFSNLFPVHSMWGTDTADAADTEVVCCASSEMVTLTKMYDTLVVLSPDTFGCCNSIAASNSLSVIALVLLGAFLHTRRMCPLILQKLQMTLK